MSGHVPSHDAGSSQITTLYISFFKQKIPGPYCNSDPVSIQTISIILFNTPFVVLGSHFEALELTLVPQNAYLGSQKQ
jgi:hypothetical protein